MSNDEQDEQDHLMTAAAASWAATQDALHQHISSGVPMAMDPGNLGRWSPRLRARSAPQLPQAIAPATTPQASSSARDLKAAFKADLVGLVAEGGPEAPAALRQLRALVAPSESSAPPNVNVSKSKGPIMINHAQSGPVPAAILEAREAVAREEEERARIRKAMSGFGVGGSDESTGITHQGTAMTIGFLSRSGARRALARLLEKEERAARAAMGGQ